MLALKRIVRWQYRILINTTNEYLNIRILLARSKTENSVCTLSHQRHDPAALHAHTDKTHRQTELQEHTAL